MPVHQFVGKRKRKRADDADMPLPVRRSALTVGAAGDWAEQAADRASHAALRRLRSQPGDDQLAARRDTGAAAPDALPAMVAAPDAVGADGGDLPDHLATRVEAARSGGSSLPTPVRRKMEGAFGTSFAKVRVHHDDEADRLGRALSARAFTTGNDIFFGAGQFRPDTPAGEQVLAHELAHTTQDSGVHRQTIHRWNINAPAIDWTQTQSIGTIDSGQPVWFFKDHTGDKIVVKQERLPIGIAEMAGLMHESLFNVKTVKHRKLSGADKHAVGGFITSPNPARLERDSWSALGAAQLQNRRFADTLRSELGDRLDTMDNFAIGHYIHSSQWDDKDQFVAMTYAAGETAKQSVKAKDRMGETTGIGTVETNRLRKLMLDLKHVQELGKMTAVDIFLGNHDRVMAGNLGNWIYDPMSAAMTAIDHVDSGVKMSFRKDQQTQSDLRELLTPITLRKLKATAAEAVDSIANGAKVMGGDDGFGAWLDSDGGYRRSAAEEAMQHGLAEGRKLLIKTFTATRFSGSKKARAVKKAIKKSSQQAMDIDTDGTATPGEERNMYFRMLKARAQYLVKN